MYKIVVADAKEKKPCFIAWLFYKKGTFIYYMTS